MQQILFGCRRQRFDSSCSLAPHAGRPVTILPQMPHRAPDFLPKACTVRINGIGGGCRSTIRGETNGKYF